MMSLKKRDRDEERKENDEFLVMVLTAICEINDQRQALERDALRRRHNAERRELGERQEADQRLLKKIEEIVHTKYGDDPIAKEVEKVTNTDSTEELRMRTEKIGEISQSMRRIVLKES